MIGDWMTTDVSEVPPKIDLLPTSVKASSEKPDLSSLFLPLSEGIPVAGDRSVVSGAQYPLAESDGSAPTVLDHRGSWHRTSALTAANEGGH